MTGLEFEGLLSWIAIGLLAGSLARLLTRDESFIGCLGTILVGVVGAVIGGFGASWLGFGGYRALSIEGLIVATLGAVVCTLLFRLLRESR